MRTEESEIDPSMEPQAGEALPERIGKYQIVRVLGLGGMGRVYEAEQANPRRRVALKVIRGEYASVELLKRFEHEAQALGRLHHPGIAQIYEAGMAPTEHGPRPYFAMELIEGEPLLRYVERTQADVRARLELFGAVCDAVEHAHQKGVIHRDLKPANILVDEAGQPRVLDFGVARLTDGDVQGITMQTDVGQLLGTLPYMSPEQVAADPRQIDTRSDVYALGVLLYELLSGRLPYTVHQKLLHDAVRTIREVEPDRLSTHGRIYRGDLETIVGKALEKEKERRYPTASELASDVRRYLRDEPIVARPPSALYQVRKFARRNTALVGGVVAVFVVLVAGVVVSALLAVRAIRAEGDAKFQLGEARAAQKAALASAHEAELAAQKAAQISGFLQNMLNSANPRVEHRPDVTVREMVDRAAKEFDDREVAPDPEVEEELRRTLASTYSGLGLFPETEVHVRRALELLDAMPNAPARELDKCRHLLALVYMDTSRFADAETLIRSEMARYEAAGRGSTIEYVEYLEMLSVARYNQGARDEAEELSRSALEVRKSEFGEESAEFATGLRALAFVVSERRDYTEAAQLLDRAVDILRTFGGRNEIDLMQALRARGRNYESSRSNQKAEADLTESLAIAERAFGRDHVMVADQLWDLAGVISSRGDTQQAAELAERALAIRRARLGDHRDTASSLSQVAGLAATNGDFDRALELQTEALEMRRRVFGEHGAAVGDSYRRLGGLYEDRGDKEKAEHFYELALENWRTSLGPEHADLSNVMLDLGRLRRAKGDLASAEQLLRDGLRIRVAASGELTGDSTEIRDDYLQVLLQAERFTEAEAMLRDVLPKYEDKLGPRAALPSYTRAQLGYALAGQGRFEEAEPLLLDGWSVIEPNAKLWKATKLLVTQWIASLYERWSKPELAAQWRATSDAYR